MGKFEDLLLSLMQGKPSMHPGARRPVYPSPNIYKTQVIGQQDAMITC